MPQKILAHAAEAKIILSGKSILKHRISKGYRLPLLDEKIRKQRTKKESRLLQKAASFIPVPKILDLDEPNSTLKLEYIPGKKIADCLDTLPNSAELCIQLGKHLAALHDAGIIHGDLTTSNMILAPDKKLYFLDFGLGFESNKIEDRAVDLHLIKEAFEAKHHARATIYFAAVLRGYNSSPKAKITLARLVAVEKRGRYKHNN